MKIKKLIKPKIKKKNTLNNLRRKSVEDLLSGSQEVLNNSLSQALSFTSGSVLQSSPIPSRRSPSPSQSQVGSPRPTSGGSIGSIKKEQSKSETHLSISFGSDRLDSNEVNYNK